MIDGERGFMVAWGMKISIKKADTREEPEFLRQFKARPVVFIGTVLVLVIVIVAFIFVPAFVPEASGAQALVFGVWNKKPVSYVPGNYFARQQSYFAQVMQYQINETNYQEVSYQVWRNAFEETVVRMAILDAVSQAGYEPPSGTVDRRVAQLPDLQENGHFSADRWNSLDSTARLSVWNDTRDEIAAQKYTGTVIDLRIPDAETEFIASMASRQRTFSMAAIPLSSWPEDELAAFAEENAGLFMTTRLSRITVKNERDANRILQSIRNGETAFEDAAKLHSQDGRAVSGGDMGFLMVYELADELENAADRETVAALKSGEFSPVFKNGDAWVFFRAEEDPRMADSSDSAVAERIRGYVMDYERGRVEDWVIAEAELFAESARDNGFERAGLFRGLEIRNFGPLPLNYGSRANTRWGTASDGVDLFPALSSSGISELASAGNLEIFWKTAFSGPAGEVCAPFVAGDNVIILIPLSEETASPESLDGIRETYTSWWLRNDTEQYMRTMFLSSGKLEDRFFQVYFQNAGF